MKICADETPHAVWSSKGWNDEDETLLSRDLKMHQGNHEGNAFRRKYLPIRRNFTCLFALVDPLDNA